MADAMNKAVLTDGDPTDGINFPQALQHAMNGRAISRDGWNGKGLNYDMSVQAQFPDANSKMTQPYLYLKVQHEDEGIGAVRTPWTPSQGDLFANDWRVL